MHNKLFRLAKRWVSYRANVNFISRALLAGCIPKGFSLRLPPSVQATSDARVAFCSVWKERTRQFSLSLMRHACAFFATELPPLHDSITTLCADLSWRDLGPLSKALENLHHRLSRKHSRKMEYLGLAFHFPVFIDPLKAPGITPRPGPSRPPTFTEPRSGHVTVSKPRSSRSQPDSHHVVDSRGRRFLGRSPVNRTSYDRNSLVSSGTSSPAPTASPPSAHSPMSPPCAMSPAPPDMAMTPSTPSPNPTPCALSPALAAAALTPTPVFIPAPCALSPTPAAATLTPTPVFIPAPGALSPTPAAATRTLTPAPMPLPCVLPPTPAAAAAPTPSTSSINLTGRDIPSAYFAVLDRGKGFCPNPGPVNNFELIQDTMDYTRRCRLTEYFEGASPRETDVPKQLYVKSTWTPPDRRCAALDLYCEKMELDAAAFIPDKRPIRDNLSKDERVALRSMRADASLTIRQADKGRRMVIMDTEDYDTAINSILSNTAIYAPLDEDPTSDITKLIHTQVGVLNERGIVSDDLHRCIIWGKVECPHFYGLPKVHKPTPPGSKLPPMRGIISSVKGPTTRASYYLDSVLNPLVPAYCGDHWCKDTTHVLQEIDSLNGNTVSYSSETHTLVAIDVVDMYNSIPHDEGVDACRDALVSLSSFSLPLIEEILTLLKLVLANNCFSFKGKFYRQIRGTAMGTPCAPAYANIFMAFLWKTRIAPGLPTQPEWLKRFLDDFLALFPAILSLNSLLTFLNSVHSTVKFTATMGLPSTGEDPPERDSDTAFMDLSVHFSEGKLHTDLFSKPTDSHTYLSPKSCHPRHIFRSIVYSGALRLRRICSKDVYFCRRLSEFAKHLVASGYSEAFIHGIFPKVAAKERASILAPSATLPTSSSATPSSATPSSSSSSATQRGITFVTTFHPRMHNVTQSHNRNAPLLHASTRMEQLLPHRPLVAMRRTANLGNLVIHTKPRDASATTNSPGFHACSSPRCQVHKKFAILGTAVTSSRTGVSFPIKEHITCSSSRVIYVLTCRRCGSQYTGKTITPLRTRFNNERWAIRNHHKLKPQDRRPYGYHFNLPDHDGENDLQVQGIEVVPEDSPILQRESFWQWQLKTHQITGGMNVAEEHFSGLTLSN